MKSKRIFIGVAFLLLLSFSFNALNEVDLSYRNILSISTSFAKESVGDYYCCPECDNPYGQETYKVECCGTGIPGCFTEPCGYNYACN